MIICSVDKTVPKYFHRRVCNSERILDSKGFPPPSLSTGQVLFYPNQENVLLEVLGMEDVQKCGQIR